MVIVALLYAILVWLLFFTLRWPRWGGGTTPSKSVMSFVLADATRLVGIFSQNGFQTIKPGARVQFALSNNSDRLYGSTIEEIAAGIGESQIASATVYASNSAPLDTICWI